MKSSGKVCLTKLMWCTSFQNYWCCHDMCMWFWPIKILIC